jgi:hypothetical protein
VALREFILYYEMRPQWQSMLISLFQLSLMTCCSALVTQGIRERSSTATLALYHHDRKPPLGSSLANPCSAFLLPLVSPLETKLQVPWESSSALSVPVP